ncbi:MAG: arsenite methyltransferase [Micropepsaceae bacterium]
MTQKAEELRTLVREQYGAVAQKDTSCCGTTSVNAADAFNIIGDAYKSVEGYVAEADLGLGCGVPTEHAGIKPGHTVLDLGSGAGVDAFVARSLVGEAGQIYGVDMTPEMVAKARANAVKLAYRNVEFRLGEIEHLPFERNSIDVVISNCVLNLVLDKPRAFAEIYRVLRPGAHFCVSDVVASAPLPDSIRNVAALYVGCIAGAEAEQRYLEIISSAGFKEARIVKSQRVDLPESALAGLLPAEAIAAARKTDLHIRSVTVIGVKPPN